MIQTKVDTHIHIWDLENIRYRWLDGNNTILNQTYHLSQLEKDRKKAGVTHGVLVQAENHLEDTDWMLYNAEQTDWIKGVVGWMPLQDPQATSDALDKYQSNPYFKGVRHLIHDEPDPEWLLQDSVIESLKILESKKLPFDLVGIKPAHIETALHVADQIPELMMVFDHLNQPPIPGKERFGKWGSLMKVASGHSYFFQKISGLGTASGNFEGWTADDLEPYLEFIFEQFTPRRCFCGGDWPVSLLAGDYVKTWEVYQKLFEKLITPECQERVFHMNAAEFYQLRL